MSSQLANVWLIEDNSTEILLTQALLEDEKIELNLRTIQDSEAILTTLKSDETDLPDLLLLDIDMPRVDGIMVLEELYKNGKIKKIPAFVLSGLQDASSKKRAINYGAVDYISKPISREKIEEIASKANSLFIKYEGDKCLLCKEQ